MQGLELGVQDGELHQPIGGLVVHVPLPCAHGRGELVRADGHEGRLLHGAAGRADPVGDAPVVAGRLALPAHPGEQHPVRLPDDPLADGQLLQHPLRLPHRGAVVEHLVDVGPALGGFRVLSGLELQDLAHGGLGALDARGKHRFLHCHGGEQDPGVGDGGERSVVARHRRDRRTDQRDEGRPVETRLGREAPLVIVNRRHQPAP